MFLLNDCEQYIKEIYLSPKRILKLLQPSVLDILDFQVLALFYGIPVNVYFEHGINL